MLFAGGAALFWFGVVPRERAAALDVWSRDLGLSADVRREALERYFTDCTADAATLATYPSARRAVSPERAGPASWLAPGESERDHLQKLLDDYVRIHEVVGVVFWDAAERPVAKSLSFAVDEGCAGSARAVLASGRPEAGAHLHSGFGPVLTFSSPIAASDGRTRGAAVVEVDPRKWVYPLLGRPPVGASTGEAVLVAQLGEGIVYLSPARQKPDAPLTFRRPLTSGFAARTVLGGAEVAGTWIDWRGIPVVGAGRKLASVSWGLVVKVDQEEALAEFRIWMRRTALGGTAILLAIAGVAWGAWQRHEKRQQVVLAESAARVLQLNRLLRTISEINALVVRAEAPGTLLAEACRILVEHGGFAMAWVGIADRKIGRVLPVARAGEASYYLDQITVRLDNTPEGRGPVGTAVRTGRHVVVADLVTEPTVAPWRSRMLAHHFRALGVFPYQVRGEVAGALTIYSTQAGAIGDEETALLDELTDDLGYALGALEIRDEHRRSEEALRQSEGRMRSLFDGMLNGFAYCEMLYEEGKPTDFVYLEVNHAFEDLTGLKNVVGKRVTEVIPGIRESSPELFERYGRVASTGKPERFEIFLEALGIWFSLSVYSPRKGHFVAIFDNVTEQKRAEEALASTQQQLLQAQKMEAVGRLAGGVAHDFNNILTVIQGYGEILSTSLPGDEKLREAVTEILDASERAAALTRQLLAFSRRQVLEMRILDLGVVASGMEKMMRRLIGEDVELAVTTPAGPALVKADPGQIEQVLLNLAVNARDAMPRGGRLSVEVAEVDLDFPLSSIHETIPPDRYVVVSVSDAGTGMDSETLTHLFEPFFTTKEKGKGTGLGLSTVFGIVKQSSGFILVESSPGKGTRFRLFFPRVPGEGASDS
ncbi:MAG: ATP-binding protein [Thermoanaerobaculia bacterium]